MAELKKYLDQAGLEALIGKIKSEDDAHLAEAKSYAEGLGSQYEKAGAAATAESNAKGYVDEKVAPLATKEEVNAVDGKVSAEETRAKAEEARIVGLVEATDAVADKAAEDVAALAQTHATDKAALEAKDEELAGAIEAVDGKIGEVAEGQTVMGIIANIQENAYDDTAIRGLITGLENNKADKTQVATDIADAVKVEEDARKEAVAGVQSAVDTLSGTHATDKAALEGAIALKADKTALEAEVERATGVEEGLEGRIETMEAFWAAAQADGTDSNVIDTLKEIQEYIAGDESGAAEMAASIKQNSDDIDALEGRADAVEGRMDTAEGKITTVEGKVSTLEGQMTTVQGAVATKAEQSALEEAIEALEGADSDLDERLQLVEAQLGDGDNSVSDLIATAKQEAIDAAAGDATSKANKALEDAKKYADEEDAKIEERVSALETASATHALASDLTALAGRVTTAEGEIDTLQTEMDAVEALAEANKAAHEANAAAIALKASQADLEAAVARIKANEDKIALKADAEDLEDAIERIAKNEEDIVANASAIAAFSPIATTDIEGLFA